MTTGSTDKNEPSGRDKFDALMNKMNETREKWSQEADSDEDEEEAKTSQMLDQAIEIAIEQGRGWSPGEKEQYLESILDDDFVSFSISILQLVEIVWISNLSCSLRKTLNQNKRFPPCLHRRLKK